MLTALILTLATVQAAGQTPRTARPSIAAWDRFPAFVWRRRHRDAEPPAELLELGGVDLKRGEDPGWARRARLAFYVGHAPGRDDLHLDSDSAAWRAPWDAWVAEGAGRGAAPDDPNLARRPCLSDPATRSRLDATLASTLARQRGGGAWFASLGDEVSLTPSQGVPWDGCRSTFCRAAWAERTQGMPMPTTDEVRRAWTAGSAEPLGAWLELRRFHRAVVEDELLRLAGGIRASAAPLPVGLLGTIGATPFGGVDLARLIPEIDVVECYPQGDAQADVETLRTLRGARPLRTLRTVFAADDTPDGAAWQISEHWVRGGDGVVVWCDGDLEDRPEHGARLLAALLAIDSLDGAMVPWPPGPLGPWLPVPSGIAVLRDDDSRALVFLEEALLDGATWPNRFPSYQAKHGLVEIAVDGWLRLFEDTGYHPGVVRFGGLDPSRFPVLVLPHVRVADARDEAELDEFLSAGGVLLVEGALGTHGRDGRPAPADAPGMLARLAERFPGRVIPVEIGDYAARRLEIELEQRSARIPPRARVALAAQSHAPIPIASTDGTPWLVTRMLRPPERGARDRGIVVAAVPNLVTPDERARLAPARIRPPTPPRGMALVWRSPAAERDGTVVVPAGAFLCFELVPTR